MPLEYLCCICKKNKPWWRFRWDAKERDVSRKYVVCFSCNTNGMHPNELVQKTYLELRINRLIDNAMKNKLSDLRNHLFETLEKVKDNEMDIDKAKCICEVAQAIINSAKVEVEAMKVVGSRLKSDFLQIEAPNEKQ